MIIIPAVDIKGGKCVRLEQGLMDRETIFSDHPEEMALQWEGKGAKRLHLVDLDGAVHGKPRNQQVIEKVVDTVSIPVQLGGGIREFATIEEYINLGVNQMIMGTIAFKDPELVEMLCERYPGKIIVAIDSRNNYVAIRGWTEPTSITSIELAKRFEGMGVAAFLYTDISRDGMKRGLNVEAIAKFAKGLKTPVIAAGGVSSLKDIEDISELEEEGVVGMIIGRALYDGSIKLEEAINMLEKRIEES